MRISLRKSLSLSELPRFRFQARSRAGRGFSLIELLGVLAVMGILAAITVPPIIRQIQQARTTNEDANLEEVARAIVEGIKATGTIPNPNLTPLSAGGWVNVASLYSTLSASSLNYVFPAEPEFKDVNGIDRTFADTARRVYIDPEFLEYLESLFEDVGVAFNTPADGWPETTAAGVNFPNQAIKLFVVSSSRPDFVLNCPPNGPNIQVEENSYRTPLINELASWIKAIDPATGFIQAPGTAIENWTDDGHQFLHVKVVDLRPLFCKVTLIDTACPPTAQISGGAAYAVNDTIVLNFVGAGCQFSFTAIAVGAFTTTGVIGDPSISGSIGASTPQMLTKPFAPIAIIDPGPPAPRGVRISDNPLGLAGNGANAELSPALPPQFQINGLAANPFGANNTQVFYVLKGSSLSLLDNGGVTLITLTVQGDSTFKFFNSTWTKVD